MDATLVKPLTARSLRLAARVYLSSSLQAGISDFNFISTRKPCACRPRVSSSDHLVPGCKRRGYFGGSEGRGFNPAAKCATPSPLTLSPFQKRERVSEGRVRGLFRRD